MPVLEPFSSQFAYDIYTKRYKHPSDSGWAGTSQRVVESVMGELFKAPKAQARVHLIQDAMDRVYDLHAARKFIAGGRYLYAAGRDFHQVNNCILLRAEDSREGWATLAYDSAMSLMTGAGIGVWYGDIRPANSPIARTGGTASGPVPLMQLVNDQGRCYLQGGNRRSAIWAGLPWWHKDIFDFMVSKDWSDEVKALKEDDWTFPAPMDMTNISVTLDDGFFQAHSGTELEGTAPDGGTWYAWAHAVYDTAVAHMLRHGEPGFTVDRGQYAGEVLRNACTEITSADDSDVCNLGSLVLPRFDNVREFSAAVRDAVLFLTAGSMYSDVPYAKVADVRSQNRRLGLGLIGVHEFLMQRGVRYGTPEAFEILEPYMDEYAKALNYAREQQDLMGLSLSKGATAIAPNGTIGIVAESTPSADPALCAAEIRQVKVAQHSGRDQFERHVVIDPAIARIVESGVDPDVIEDAYSLAGVPERRLMQQVFLQRYVDHAISSTVNLPQPITDEREAKDFGDTLLKYLPDLRGVTIYPNGARAGQPRQPVDLQWALNNQEVIVEGDEETCIGGVCGV